MNKFIESVKEDKRPREGFACSNCPFSAWHSGEVEYQNYNTLNAQGVIKSSTEEFLDCYCHKTHQYTFDSSKRTSATIGNENKSIVIYKHITKCQDQQLAINEILGAK